MGLYPKKMLRSFIISSLICLQVVTGRGQSSTEKPYVLTTTSFLADMAKTVSGDLAIVESIMPLGGDPHIYDPIPEDAQKIVEADLILKNGLTLEGWLDEMLENAGTSAPIVTLSNGIPAIESADYANAYDPHAWMNPRYGLIYIENIKVALQALLPEHTEDLEANYQLYKDQIIELDRYIEKRIEKIPPGKRVLATSHDAFRYYGNRYGLKVESIMGTSTDAEIRMQDFQHLVDVVQEHQLPAIFVESTINPKQLLQMAQDLGIVVGGKLFADSLGDKESGADTYLSMLRQNTDLIVQGLSRRLAGEQTAQNRYFLWIILLLFSVAFLLLSFQLFRSRGNSQLANSFQLKIEGLSVSYDRKLALSNIYLELNSAKVIGLIGSNGSGKSTLFKSILGLTQVDYGQITLQGEEIDRFRKEIAYIPQKEEIDWSFPATVLDIVLMGRYPHRHPFENLKKEDKEIALQALEKMGIKELLNKQIGELSGGQQQRVFIARALCQQATIYLMDEPFVGVDIKTEGKIMEIVKDLAEEGKMVIIIHHDLAKVKEYFDDLIMLNQRLVAFGPTEEVFTDENIKKTYGGRLTILQQTENYI